MRHFSSEQWTDFVRSTGKPEEMREMQSHLEAGCKECRTDWAAWARVSDLADREGAFVPSADAVKMVKAAISLHTRPARSPFAKLLFDSLSAPALAGVRSSDERSRQVLYGFDDYRVDLRFEPNVDSDRALVVGQILKSGDTNERFERIVISLVRGGQVLGTARANEFGEFQLECHLGGRLELQLTLPDGADLRVPMVEPSGYDAKLGHMQIPGAKRLKNSSQAKSKSTRKKV